MSHREGYHLHGGQMVDLIEHKYCRWYQNDFFILGVAILLLVVIAQYVDRGIPTTARKSGIAETSFLRSSSPTQ